ncbi:multiple epidermal growth factor-like domains protein 10 isoform X2 [Saccostrea cucullata]|uniref:multiple epidermal growth factor-like domains protein 10 isoform X2 n=1 Tax=Saccostrea cuccullata TaxID=36930 RepID=UPI002ED41DBE
MGYDCSETCPPGTYGEGCERKCSGNCANNETCHKVDGFCPGGCHNGFQGNRCSEEIDIGVNDFTKPCTDQGDNVGGLTAGLIISLLINVGLCFTVLYFIRKKENNKRNSQASYEVSDSVGSQRSSSGGHLENHAYEDLNVIQARDALQVYRNLALNDTNTNTV